MNLVSSEIKTTALVFRSPYVLDEGKVPIKKIRFSKAVKHYGVSHSLDAFKITVDLFGSALFSANSMLENAFDVFEQTQVGPEPIFYLVTSLLTSINTSARSYKIKRLVLDQIRQEVSRRLVQCTKRKGHPPNATQSLTFMDKNAAWMLVMKCLEEKNTECVSKGAQGIIEVEAQTGAAFSG
ncbi:hypothetical protein FEM48_Zijuj06G0174300 [Ziziphus jujuba var. spinosa]|uniref:Uncharacterized protein n=1 Tax=Ziziphus jujuba var. spinosa TaxID=714518 RepID=A0A978VAM1_ZIZJJ|nr:hypothetical protein FEM48_Zijuj06G0174300 [Ziziphus jujuba var. spinosa]